MADYLIRSNDPKNGKQSNTKRLKVCENGKRLIWPKYASWVSVALFYSLDGSLRKRIILMVSFLQELYSVYLVTNKIRELLTDLEKLKTNITGVDLVRIEN